MAFVTILAYLATFCALIFALVWLYSRWSFSKSREKFLTRNVSYVHFPNSIFRAFVNKRMEFDVYERVKKYGQVFGLTVFGLDTIVVTVPELAQVVLSKEFTSFINRRRFNFNDPMFYSILSVAEDEQWKRIRSIVTPTFSTGKLRLMKPRIDDTMVTLMKNFENTIHQNPIVNVKEIFGAYTMDTIMQIAFGTKVDSLIEKDNPIILSAKNMFSMDMSFTVIVKFLIITFMPRLAKFLNFRNQFMIFFKGFSKKLIQEKRENLKRLKNFGKANNFIELLLEAEVENEMAENVDEEKNNANKSSKFMTTDEIIANCILFFIAAYDTTTSTVSLASYLLALNPSVQDRLYEEIEAKLDKLRQESPPDQEFDINKSITFESLAQFEYLNAVVNETIRLNPSAPVERTASRDVKLETEDGSIVINVKKGDFIQFPTYSMHRDPRYFPEPEQFKPERFLGEQTFHKYAYLPFGSGPRNCVARNLALMEIKIALLNVVHKYRLVKCEQTKIPVEYFNNGAVLTPKEVILKLEKR